MTRPRTLWALLSLVVACTAVTSHSVAQEGPFTRVEYWECPSENLEPLVAAVDSIWGPVFDQMTEEGHFESWLWERPVAARDYEFVGGQEGSEEVSPPWQFVGVWTTENEEAMDAAWEEFFDRLEAEYPDVPTPARYCGDLLIVDYVQGGGS